MSNTSERRKIVVVGGVAGGMSFATRARRLSEQAEIVVVERGEFPSFANCGLPYHVGGEIADRGKLIVRKAEDLRRDFRLDVRTKTEVVAIDRSRRVVRLRAVDGGAECEESYNALVLATGAAPLRPPIPGIEQPGHFTLRSIPDMDRILAWLNSGEARRAVVVGGGYIGLEMAEQLHHRGLEVSLVEALPQVMAPLDPEMAALLHAELRGRGIRLMLGDGVDRFDPPTGDGRASVVVTKSGQRVPADVVILGLGVRPEVWLARDAGLEIGERGGIRVDERMRTSDPHVYAVGDAVEVRDRITGEWTLIPLAGPANRMGRIVADQIFGIDSTYKGTQGTGVLRLFDLVAATTGANEKTLKRVGRPYRAIHLHPGSHAGYYPGAHPIAMKILFDPATGLLLGAQAVGRDGVDKRIDVLATALAANMTVDDLAELELAYAPPIGSAKDPVNLSGMIGQNIRRGLVETADWTDVARLDPERQLVLDVRNAAEVAGGAIPGSKAIPLCELRNRLGELPRDKELIVHCASGQRSYNTVRLLLQHGFRARNLSGSFKTWQAGTGA
ncbi:MAG: FAD-dependent oxidoreductase [Candidatus Sumerlaeia bacterium]|nr:FAD-dependent oxidoreductase [Candidatus Sumerlaeia bacterium]